MQINKAFQLHMIKNCFLEHVTFNMFNIWSEFFFVFFFNKVYVTTEFEAHLKKKTKLQKCETIYSISNFVLRGDQIWVEFPDHIYGNLSADMLTIPTKPNFIKVITTYSWLLSIPIRSIPFNVAKK